MTVYAIAQLKMIDRAAYDRYQARFFDVFKKFNGRLLSADEKPAIVEGAWDRDKLVLMSFPDETAFHAWADSPEYLEISKDRKTGAQAVVRETKIISHQPEVYHGWPTLVRCSSGRLLLAYSGGRESHVCPFGRVELMQSDDNGQSWTWPRVLLDTAIDDRDSGVLETARGTILVTTFTSLAYESILDKAEQNPEPEKNPWPLPPERLDAWRAAHRGRRPVVNAE